MSGSSGTPGAIPTRELAAIMLSDIAGYTATMGRDERKALRALDDHRELLRTILPSFNGRLVGEIGDGTLSSFHSALDAVNCARAAQAALQDDPSLKLRIGIHLGDVVFSNNTVLGDGVNVASRIHALASPGAICISANVYDEIRNKPEFQVKDLGEQKFKNVDRPIRVYSLVASAPSVPLSGAQPSVGRRAILAGVGALLLAAVAYGVVKYRLPAPSIPAAQPATARVIRSIAVLPLDNYSGDPNQEYFADGMTDELITDLAKISALRVISRSSVMQYKGDHRRPPPEIAKTLNIDAVVEGSVLRIGDKVRITVQLIDAPVDKHLWAESYERDSRDLLAMQDELASAIAHQINIALTPGEQARLSNARSVNPQAVEALLKGRYFLGKVTSDGFQRAKEYFEQAIKIAPDFAPGYAGLAEVYWAEGALVISNKEAVAKAKEPLEKALRLDDSNALAHSLLGWIHWSYEYDWAAAEREHRRAIALGPGDADVHTFYGAMLTWQGRFDEAEREYRLAQQLDPLSSIRYVPFALMLNFRGDYTRAMEQSRRALEIDPNSLVAHLTLSVSYESMGDHVQALKEAQWAVALEPGPEQTPELGVEYAKSGNLEQAREVIEQLKRMSAHAYVSPARTARIYAALGDKTTALDLLEKAHEDRDRHLLWIKVDHDYDSLRSEPRFIELLKKVGLNK
jgi:TolB-like protein/class 3 adenylate cyclase/Tfp pilus assembly protein PilF